MGSRAVTIFLCSRRTVEFAFKPFVKQSTKSVVCSTSPGFHLQQQYRFCSFSSISISTPSVTKLTMTTKTNTSDLNANSDKEEKITPVSSSAHNPQAAILRYLPGDERFQLKLILSNGKVFNFDRSAKDSIETFIDRMCKNLSKKLKAWDEKVILLSFSKTDTNDWIEFPINDVTIPTESIFEGIGTGLKKLKIKISDELYEVAVNPPEIYGIKLLKQSTVGFPILPYKIEASSNFLRKESKYKWEFANEQDLKSKSGKIRRKSGEKNVQADSIWKDTGCKTWVYVPTENVLGTKLRFTCIPSDGNSFGLAFSVELPGTVEAPSVGNPLFMERVSRMQEHQSDPNFLRVVSYNCLADTYATEEWFISSPKGSLSADIRLPFLCKELTAYQADLFCLQEVDEKYFEGIFSPYFNSALNYEGIFTSKVGNTKEGVTTFYNPNKFDLLRNESIVILEHMKLQSFWDKINSISPEFSTRLQDRNTVLQLSIFKHKGPENTILVVANTHLYFHPDADHIRLLQTITCIDYIQSTVEEIKKAFPQLQVALLFCGDFNCTPPFSSYRYLTSGKIEANDFDWTSHGTEKLDPGKDFEHELKLKNCHPGEELTNITTCFEGCIDYILYQPEHFKVLETYPPPTKSVIASMIGVDETRKVSLPNFHTPSDHLPLISDFLLLSSSKS